LLKHLPLSSKISVKDAFLKPVINQDPKLGVLEKI